MDFFGIGFGEVILILVVALIIWGPNRIVEIGMKLGKITRALRKATFDITNQVTRELESTVEKQISPADKGHQADDKGNPGKQV